MQQTVAGLQRLENAACLQAYASSMSESAWRNVLLVTDITYSENTLLAVFVHNPDAIPSDLAWACNDTIFAFDTFQNRPSQCNVRSLVQNAADWTILWHPPCDFPDCVIVDAPIKYCLTQPFPELCTINISITILAVVVVCNVIKATAMVITLFSKHDPLANVGDTIASFLDQPANPEACLSGPLSARDVRRGKWKPHGQANTTYSQASTGTAQPLSQTRTPRKPRSTLSFCAATPARWIITILLCLVVWEVGLGLLFLGRRNSQSNNAISTLWTKANDISENVSENQVSMILGPSLISNVLLANLPQLAISFVYLWYNNVLTCMLLARETSAFVKRPKPLRVSRPIPDTSQRSTYWLQLPYQYIIPLMTAMATLHWLVSRSIFLVQMHIYDSNGVHDPSRDINECGYSVPAIELSLGLGGILILVLLLLGFVRLPSGVPLVGSCSAAIAAACASNQGDPDASTGRLMYGVVLGDSIDRVPSRRVGLSAGPVEKMQDGVTYT